MVNKKGFMKIVEATIAVLLVFSAIILLSSRNKPEVSTRDLTTYLPPLLDKVARDSFYRDKIILEYNTSLPHTDPGNKQIIYEIEKFLKPDIANPSLNFTIRICKLDELCFLEPYPVSSSEDIFAAERVITTSLQSKDYNFQSKKLKMFLWKIGK